MASERSGYLAYLMRVCRTRDGERQIWRASLELPGTGERYGFASLEDLFDFVRQQVEASERVNDEEVDPY